MAQLLILTNEGSRVTNALPEKKLNNKDKEVFLSASEVVQSCREIAYDFCKNGMQYSQFRPKINTDKEIIDGKIVIQSVIVDCRTV